MNNTSPNTVTLAPMEGVLDPLMRQLLTEINDYDLCVTEFVRVVDCLLPEHIFYKLSPELKQGGVTSAGTPVRIQLLGQDPQALAENALRAIELGSPGIDLNFGCPAKLVNKSRGGAALLKTPNLIRDIIEAVRRVVPSELPVSAKIRLGWESAEESFDIAAAVEQAGASSLAVHGRTKMCGYKAERINWPAIAAVREQVNIPVVANGEIWSHQDALECVKVTGCRDIMLGRGALNTPNLGNVVKYNAPAMTWQEVMALLLRYTQLECRGDKGKYFPNRIKQWFAYLNKVYPEAKALWPELRVLRESAQIVDLLNAQGG
ncbi:tRNA dihydrouridine(16) synthase DusC [Aliagarivorans taiwanensis]|uniref:tRNA dihydrouridine(16) synthase DusC n=1 Tax=Aliagarivorans taiwanensis TaxID=561966 RepID=UPI000550D8AC|nr:tRNA dihydrouridine(16) synthase DusC [Aliagarivorans taiwanensis]